MPRVQSKTPKKVAIEEMIEVTGARVHNLKNIDISIPKNKLVVITGISGSGKSSLAFDTIYAEGQRRYLETFGAYARQFVGDMERPDVDRITGLSPVIAIEQKTTSKNPRSTVGTVTEVYDFLRLLFARIGKAYSYNTGKPMVKWSEEEIVQAIVKNFSGKKISILAPLVRGRKGHYRELFEDYRKKGYLKMRIDGVVKELQPKMQVDRYVIHDIELVVDRMLLTTELKARLSQSVQQGLQLGKGLLFIEMEGGKLTQYSRQLMCEETGLSYEEPSPNSFSFNSPYGACPACKGLGVSHHVNMSQVIPDPSLSISEGGIAPLGEERDAWVFRQAQELARKNKISVKTPVGELPKKQLNLLLYGNEEGSVADIDFSELKFDPNAPFEGVVNLLHRWYANPYSESIREWTEAYMEVKPCASCMGTRLRKESNWFRVDTHTIAELSALNLDNLAAWFDGLELRLDKKDNQIGKDIFKEIRDRLEFLLQVGLGYLSLNRPSRSLSGGESQRIRLATQIGSQLRGITYILDEPSIGLHQRDNHQLIEALKKMRDLGNTVLVVEHDKDIMLAADHLIDVGPKAGFHGGKIVAQGKPASFLKLDTLTAGYLNGKHQLPVPAVRRAGNGKVLSIKSASGNNLQNVNVDFPLGKLIVVTGVSGSGKSTLINETLYPILAHHCFGSRTNPLSYKKVTGLEHIDKVIEIDQSPIGRTPRSNPATYCGFFTEIRTLFASLPESKVRGYTAGRFSFNVKSGRCNTCEGGGMRVIEMNFLPDVYVHCSSCNGKRYNRETLEIRYKGKSISDVLEMTVEEALTFFTAVPYLYRKIKVLEEVGLGYITLGQAATTLSGGEAQRIKLSTELAKRETGKTFYILDEPTTGLHFEDITHLMDVLTKLVDRGNTVLVIEHNMDVIKMADHIIDLGPEGGDGGGKILFEGTPEELVKKTKTHTARFLKQELQ
ncbi:MAG TPA: excinuclease ABC subunit UvrA [Chitinophagaceae bacterium]|nr:excinuclease ABC subunit UvrA [Chitinophagaceae bacterium]